MWNNLEQLDALKFTTLLKFTAELLDQHITEMQDLEAQILTTQHSGGKHFIIAL